MNCYIYIATDERLREQVEIRGRITDVLPSGSTWGSQVAVIRWQGEYLDALAVLRMGARVANYKTRLTISDFYEFDSRVPVDILLSVIDEPLRSAVADGLTTGGQLSPEAAKTLREALAQLRPGLEEEWARLEEIADQGRSSLWVDDREPIIAYERDAVGLVLSVAGFDRNEILRGWTGDSGVPFLDGLSEFQAGEDAIIAHDAQVFGDWDALRPSLTGITRFKKGERELTVVNAKA